MPRQSHKPAITKEWTLSPHVILPGQRNHQLKYFLRQAQYSYHFNMNVCLKHVQHLYQTGQCQMQRHRSILRIMFQILIFPISHWKSCSLLLFSLYFLLLNNYSVLLMCIILFNATFRCYHQKWLQLKRKENVLN